MVNSKVKREGEGRCMLFLNHPILCTLRAHFLQIEHLGRHMNVIVPQPWLYFSHYLNRYTDTFCLWQLWLTAISSFHTQKGNIFIYDMRRMDGIPGRDGDNGGPLQSVTPGLCLFYSNPEKQLKPIAIQVTPWCPVIFPPAWSEKRK